MEEKLTNFKIYVIAEIFCICLFAWFGLSLLRVGAPIEEPVVSNTINFAGTDLNQNSYLNVDVAQNDRFIKFQVTQGSPSANLCPQGDSDPSDCAQVDKDPQDLQGIDMSGATVWQVQPGSYTLIISDNAEEKISYNLSVIHQPGINTIMRLSLSTLGFGVASIVCGWLVLREIKKRKLQVG